MADSSSPFPDPNATQKPSGGPNTTTLYNPYGQNPNGPPTTPTPSGGLTGTSPGPQVPNYDPSAQPNAPFGSAQGADLYNTLASRAAQSLNVDPNDPTIANQVNSYRAEQDRGNRNTLAADAERQGPNANLTSETRLGNETAAQNTGTLQGQLIQNELTSRRTEIQNALTQMGGLLTSDQQLALQKQLGLLDASINQQGVNNALALGTGQLGVAQEQADTAKGVGFGNLGISQQAQDLAKILGTGNLAINQQQADTAKTLGEGNLGVAQATQASNAALGQGNLDLNRTQESDQNKVAQGNLGVAQATQASNAALGEGNLGVAQATQGANERLGYGTLLNADQQTANTKDLGLLQALLTNQGQQSSNDQFAKTYGLNSTNSANYWDWLRSTGSAPSGAPS